MSPALGGKTPRQAIRTPKGRKETIRLLESYGRHEKQLARDQKRSEVSFAFLWEEIGLERDG